jgi:hypothetical protein
MKLMLCQTIIKRGLINKMKSSLSSVLKPFLQVIFYYQHPYYSPSFDDCNRYYPEAENGISDEHVAAA